MGSRKIMSYEFMEALARAGVLGGDLSAYHRIVIDAEAGQPLTVYAEWFGDTRWLEVAPVLTGVEVHTEAIPEPVPLPRIAPGCSCAHQFTGPNGSRRFPDPDCHVNHPEESG